MIESPRHELDDAIDRVAAKLVAVTDDGRVLQQVMTRLPERTASPWFAAMPLHLAAGAALVLIAFVYPRSSREPAPLEPQPVAVRAPGDVLEPAPGRRNPAVATRLPTPDSRLRRGFHLRQGFGGRVGGQARLPRVALDRPDHERSLAPVDAIEALELSAIAAPALELDTAAAFDPLVLTEVTPGERSVLDP